MNSQEIIKTENKNRTSWAIYTRTYRYGSPGDNYIGAISDNRDPETIAHEICKNTKRKRYEVKIGAIIIL
jgi:hypothetical protein